MSNKQKYKDIFIKSLAMEGKKFNENVKYNEITEWDSIGHMALVAAIEWEFDVMLDTDEILDMSSVKKVKDILLKHGVEF